MDEYVKQFLIGSFLGDGCFVRKTEHHNTYIVFKHCASQLGYLTWKYNFLKSNGYIKSDKGVREVNIKEGSVYPNHQPQFTFSTASFEEFNFFKDLAEEQIVNDFGSFALAVWLLDDGGVDRKTIKISAGSKSESLCSRLVKKMNSTLGTNAVYYKHPNNSAKNYIRFMTGDYETLKSIVKCFIPADVDVVHDKFCIECDSVSVKVKYHTGKESATLMPNSDWIDLRAAETVELKKDEYRLISLGVSMQLPSGFEAHIAPRSSTFKHWGILLVNGIGIIDNSFCGDNDVWSFPALATRDTTICEGDRICQFRIMRKQPVIRFEEVDHLGNEDRGGIGSTGRM